MSNKSVSPSPTWIKPSLAMMHRTLTSGWVKILGRLGMRVSASSLPRLNPTSGSAPEGVDRGSTTISSVTDSSPFGFGQNLAWLAAVFGLRLESTRSAFRDSHFVSSGEGLERLARESKPERQKHLLAESLDLLDEFDRRLISWRLEGNPYEFVAKELNLQSEAVATRYALAVNRLAERLAWVALLEERGVSPPERAVLGQARFSGRTAQEIALRLRLPEDLVEYWLRLSSQEPDPRLGANR